jgi:hypothetical protein
MVAPLALLALGAALTGGGIYASSRAERQRIKARNNTLATERARQDEFAEKAAAQNAAARDRYRDAEAQQQAKATDLQALFRDAPTTADGALADANVSAASVLPSATSDILVREQGKQRDATEAFTGQQADARARLRSFGDLFSDIGTATARDAGYIGQTNAARQGSANVLPYELEAANQKGAGLRLLGDVLKGLGSIALTGGMAGAFSAPAATAAGVGGGAAGAGGAAGSSLGAFSGAAGVGGGGGFGAAPILI